MEYWTDIGIQFGTVFLAVGLGLVAALWHERKKRDGEEKVLKNKVINSLLNELKINRVGIEAFDKNRIVWDPVKEKFQKEYGLGTNYIFESVVKGGNLILLSIELQNALSQFYHGLEMFNSFMIQIMNFNPYLIPTTDRRKEVAESLIFRLYERLDALKLEVGTLITKLEKSVEK